MHATWIPSIVLYLFKLQINGIACYYVSGVGGGGGRNIHKFEYVSKPVSSFELERIVQESIDVHNKNCPKGEFSEERPLHFDYAMTLTSFTVDWPDTGQSCGVYI